MPKIRAMQIISELEGGGASVHASRLVSSLAPPTYAGCVGYFNYNDLVEQEATEDTEASPFDL